ncbi:MAG: GGDEF domain-containing protein [Phycisphaerales bacterium]|nr:GGDEF domain-containing protein [Phycisphaerales bacterium]
MSGASSSRSARRRILAVGEVPITESGSGGPQTVANIFEALGEVAVAPASSPIDAIVLAITCDSDGADLVRAAESIRRLDPTVQIVAIVDEPPVPEIQPHVDYQIGIPVTTETLADLLEGRVAPGQPSSESPPAEPTMPPVRDAAPTPEIDLESTKGEGGFGDTDLVEALLYSPGNLRERAIHIIEQQTGMTGIRLLERESSRSVPVRFAGRTYGHLIAGRKDEDMRPWANWLARWLALEDAQATLRQMAYRDELTGAWNRRYLNHFLSESIEESRRMRRQLTVMVFDIDDFKTFNDQYGHDAGDIILRETIRLLGSVIRTGDRVCRVGGDEFAVVFADLEAPRTAGSTHPDSVEKIARRFQAQIARMRFPRLGLQAPGTLSISGGLASYPWDAAEPAGLLRIADQRALESKRRGKNFLTIGPGASFTNEGDSPPSPPSPTGPPR